MRTDLAPAIDGKLNPRFVEWLMGFPVGWTEVPGATRRKRLAALGNAVVWQQAALAWRLLTGDTAATETNVHPSAWPTPDGHVMNDGDTKWRERRERELAKHQNGNGFGLTLAMAVQDFRHAVRPTLGSLCVKGEHSSCAEPGCVCQHHTAALPLATPGGAGGGERD